MGLFERYLSLWVALCILAGVVLGNTAPDLFALATVVGVLVEVPVMLSLVAFANRTRHWFVS